MNSRFRPMNGATAAKLMLLFLAEAFSLTAFATYTAAGSKADKADGPAVSETGSSIRGELSHDRGWHDPKVTTLCDQGAPVTRIPRLSPKWVARGNNSISGFVFTDSRRPVPNIYVELLNDVGATLSRTKTSVSGLFTFRGLSDGVFYVKVLPYNLNYIGEERRVSLVSVSARPGFGSISEQVDFYLKPKTTTSGPFAAPGVVFAQEVPQKAKQLYNQGIDLLEQRRDEEGFERLRQSIEVFPKYYEALDRLGSEYVLRGYYRPAALLLANAIEINRKSFSSSFGLGLAQFRLNQLDQALVSFGRAIELYRDSVQANLWYGIALHAKGRYNEAEMALNAASRLSKGESADVHWQLARVYKDQGRFGEAAAELELFLKLKPDAPNAEEIKKTIAILKQKPKPLG